MWTPLPQVLEQCLHRAYQAHGWDLTGDANPRLEAPADRALAFPTLSDLAAEVDDVTRELGYDKEAEDRIRAALHTRLNGLRAGGKGRMLDVQQSLPIEALLDRPTVLELESMGDDDDKAFVMGLLLIRLFEHRRAGGMVGGLQHVLVIEEAHRLLANVAQHGPVEEANPRGKAVEAFANLLSEIRAYGQGVIIADQVPVRLAPDVIKNTNLKVAHRIVAADDRLQLAGAMAMSERQALTLATLVRGQAAVFSEGQDAPVLVQVDRAKDQPGQVRPDDREVAALMQQSSDLGEAGGLFRTFPACAESCPGAGQACQAARRILEGGACRQVFARLVASAAIDADALDRLWPDLTVAARADRPPGVDGAEALRCLLVRGSEWFAGRRGAQAGWTYAATSELADRLRRMLLAKLEDAEREPVRAQFREAVARLHSFPDAPLPGCDHVCRRGPHRYDCIYRFAAADLAAAGTYDAAWHAADEGDRIADDRSFARRWEVCQDAGYELTEFYELGVAEASTTQVIQAAIQASLCFGQQMLRRQSGGWSPRVIARDVEALARASEIPTEGGDDV